MPRTRVPMRRLLPRKRQGRPVRTGGLLIPYCGSKPRFGALRRPRVRVSRGIRGCRAGEWLATRLREDAGSDCLLPVRGFRLRLAGVLLARPRGEFRPRPWARARSPGLRLGGWVLPAVPVQRQRHQATATVWAADGLAAGMRSAPIPSAIPTRRWSGTWPARMFRAALGNSL